MLDKKITEIFETKDYSKFKNISTNRDLNPKNVTKLRISMKKKFLISPIHVTPNMDIIDGKHRYSVSQELDLPIYYYILPSNNVEEEMIIRNTVQEKWRNPDFGSHYVKKGDPDYIILDEFKKEHPELTHRQACRLLSGLNYGVKQGRHVINDDGTTYNDSMGFQNGHFKVNVDVADAHDDAYDMDAYRKHIKMTSGLFYVLGNIFRCPEIDKVSLLKKIELEKNQARLNIDNRTKLLVPPIEKWRIIEYLNDIYNKRRPIKVSFNDLLKKKSSKA